MGVDIPLSSSNTRDYMDMGWIFGGPSSTSALSSSPSVSQNASLYEKMGGPGISFNSAPAPVASPHLTGRVEAQSINTQHIGNQIGAMQQFFTQAKTMVRGAIRDAGAECGIKASVAEQALMPTPTCAVSMAVTAADPTNLSSIYAVTSAVASNVSNEQRAEILEKALSKLQSEQQQQGLHVRRGGPQFDNMDVDDLALFAQMDFDDFIQEAAPELVTAEYEAGRAEDHEQYFEANYYQEGDVVAKHLDENDYFGASVVAMASESLSWIRGLNLDQAPEFSLPELKMPEFELSMPRMAPQAQFGMAA